MVKSVGTIPISPLPRINVGISAAHSTWRPPTHTNIDSGGGGGGGEWSEGGGIVVTHNVNDSLK